jgi:hypothetical protein
LPATSVKRSGSSLTIEIKGIGVLYNGKIADGLGTIDGKFTQMGNTLSLSLERLKD